MPVSLLHLRRSVRLGPTVRVSVSSPSSAMRVAAVSDVGEEEEADEVGDEAGGADGDDQLGVCDFCRVEEAGDGLEADRKAQREEEDAVDECSEDFGPLPAVRILGR